MVRVCRAVTGTPDGEMIAFASPSGMVEVVVGSGSLVDVVEICVAEVKVEAVGEAVVPSSTLKTVHAPANTARRIRPIG